MKESDFYPNAAGTKQLCLSVNQLDVATDMQSFSGHNSASQQFKGICDCESLRTRTQFC